MAVERTYFVPGRVELFGKHTDYAGGRSLICAIDRGLRVRVRSREDSRLRVESAGHDTVEVLLEPDLKASGAASSHYVETVAKRLSRDFGELRGADITVSSDLPQAAGLSSSSAFVIAIACAVMDVNTLSAQSPESLAQYLGGVETGVGTHGGSQDHTAILCARAGEVAQYSFAPVRREASIVFPERWTLMVAVSGVSAHKSGAARDRYNRAAADAARLRELLCDETGREDTTLAEALRSSPDALQRLRAIVARRASSATQKRLLARVEQFCEESEQLVPAAAGAIARTDLDGLKRVAERSQALAETALHNQVPETIALAHKAYEMGAAASAFGAGFGGSVWAIAPKQAAAAFLECWETWYRAAHPAAAAAGARFFQANSARFSTGCTAAHLVAVENEGANWHRS
ncbi:MAG: GHMP family kinase ATP-binding protein [Vulcanimicrobiaceae bacterium]